MLETCLRARRYQRISEDVWTTPSGVRVWIVRCTHKEAGKIPNKAKSNDMPRCIVLTTDSDTPHKNFEDEDVYVEYFAQNEPCMLVDPTQNVRVKPHRVVTDCPYKTDHLPKIQADDVIARWIGAMRGDVVQVGDDSWFEIV